MGSPASRPIRIPGASRNLPGRYAVEARGLVEGYVQQQRLWWRLKDWPTGGNGFERELQAEQEGEE